MHVRILSFKADPGKKSEITSIADKFIPKIKSQEGCLECQFLVEDQMGEYGLMVHWDTKEHADIAKSKIGPELIPLLSKIAAGEPRIVLYEAYGGK